MTTTRIALLAIKGMTLTAGTHIEIMEMMRTLKLTGAEASHLRREVGRLNYLTSIADVGYACLMNSYRVEYTEMKPGGTAERQYEEIRGGLQGVRDYLDSRAVLAADPIVVTEHVQSDGCGRIVPASEWDIIED